MILIEQYVNERETKIIVHCLFGRRITDCLSRAVAFAYLEQSMLMLSWALMIMDFMSRLLNL